MSQAALNSTFEENSSRQEELESSRRRDRILENLTSSLSEGRKKTQKVQKQDTSLTLMQKGAFVAAFMAALLKDLFDLVALIFEFISGATVALAPLAAVGMAFGFVITWCISIFIMFMLILAGQGTRAKKRGLYKKIANKALGRFLLRFVIFLGFSSVESVPGLGVLPLETIMVGLILFMTLRENKKG